MPEPLSKSAHTTCFVDSNHSGSVVTWSLHTGVLIYVMNTPIIWFSNNHNSVYSSTFGSELVEIWITRGLIASLHCKLRIFAVPLDGTSDVICDNQLVFNTTSSTQSNLGKKKMH